ncbi:MAG: B12-binding domain-containing protein [Candidatus Lokiarchaeota archaeon]|nr:B12-binding domain-containing protein [Candidatus Lokiarchaeota archaeon]
MAQKQFYGDISDAIVNLDKEKAIELAKRAITEKWNLLEVIEKGYGDGIRRIGDLWEEGEFFLPELMLGGNIMQESMDILLPSLKESGASASIGVVVIATIEGDIHSIGKTIVGTMLSANGFDVYDLGADVPAEKIIETAVEKNADVIGVSALLTTTMFGQKKIIDILEDKGIRNKFKVIIGGAPVTKEWTEECKADGFAGSAVGAVKLVKNLLNK